MWSVRNVTGLPGRSYLHRLAELRLLTLKDRRIYLDMIETYKIIYCISCDDPSRYFELSGSRRRRETRLTNYPRNIITKRSNLDIRKNFFTQRVGDNWNNLPVEIKDAPNISTFKKSLKIHMLSSYSGQEGGLEMQWIWNMDENNLMFRKFQDGALRNKTSSIQVSIPAILHTYLNILWILTCSEID